MKAVWRESARLEFLEALAWYDEHTLREGERFAREVAAVIEKILNNPRRYPPSPYDTRHAPVAGFPYRIHYIERDAGPVIVAVHHEKRNPDRLKGRSN